MVQIWLGGSGFSEPAVSRSLLKYSQVAYIPRLPCLHSIKKRISFLPSMIEIGLSLVYMRVSQNFSKLDLIGCGGWGVSHFPTLNSTSSLILSVCVEYLL